MNTSILVIEDDGYTTDYLENRYWGHSYSIQSAANGKTGLKKLNQANFDIVFADLYLPDMDGRDMLEAAVSNGVETRFLMVSARKNIGAVVDCMKLGAFDFLEKPFRPDDFDLTFRKVEDRIRLETELQRLKNEVEKGSAYSLLFGNGQRLRDVQMIIDQIADTDITVLLRGESGTGKDLLARAISQCSSRRDKPFMKINCAALPRELLESELFGHEEGAFSGATRSKPGKFEYANGGTLFMDEITEMHIDLQAKLLHVLQDAEVCRLGAKEPVPIDVRIVASTNRNIEDEVQKNTFRKDLFYRLNVVNIVSPPLRERPEDIERLAEYFFDKFSLQYRRTDASLSPDFIKEMKEYPWPGNVRELENYMRRIVVVGDVDGVRAELRKARMETSRKASEMNCVADPHEFDGKTLRQVSKEAMLEAEKLVLGKVLRATRWNRTRAAEKLDISYKALLYKIKETGLE